MSHAIVYLGILLSLDPNFVITDARPKSQETETYRALCALVARDSDSHVRLALWCESHEMPAVGAESYFVGAMGALVHDGSEVQPGAIPFDSAEVLAATKPGPFPRGLAD